MKIINLGYSKAICTENIFKEIDRLLKENSYLFSERGLLPSKMEIKIKIDKDDLRQSNGQGMH